MKITPSGKWKWIQVWYNISFKAFDISMETMAQNLKIAQNISNYTFFIFITNKPTVEHYFYDTDIASNDTKMRLEVLL